MPDPRLSEASYIVLGLLERMAPATPYDLKQIASLSTTNFWSVPHTQLYAECARLAREGLLLEEREQEGRRRRIYRLSELGEQALERWRTAPTEHAFELRDTATLKLFFGADPRALAESQVESHTRRLESFRELQERLSDAPEGWRLALQAGIGHELEFIRFWSELAQAD